MSGLWVEESGPDDASLVVLVHGSMDRSTSFSKLVRRLRDLRTVVYDRRGYGQSVEVGPPYAVAQQLEDLWFVMQERRGVVIGHSYGGNIGSRRRRLAPNSCARSVCSKHRCRGPIGGRRPRVGTAS